MKKLIVTFLIILLITVNCFALQKNVASQKWTVFAFNRTTNVPVTGDSSNITANVYIDGASNAVDDTNPTELEDGFYQFDMAQAETNGENIVMCPQSSTGNVQVIGCPMSLWTTPANFPDTSIDTSGYVKSELTKMDGGSSDQTVLDAIGFFDVSVQPAKNYGSDVATVLQQTPTSEENRHEGHILLDTTIATVVTPDTVITLTAGENTYDGFYVGHEAVIEDDSSSTRRVTAMIAGYTASTRTLTFASDPTPGAWTLDADDKIWIRANRKSLTWTDFFMIDLPAGAPSATAAIKTAMNWIYEAWRNKTVTNGSTGEVQLMKDNETTIAAEADYSDDGTSFSRGEYKAED